MAKRYAIWNKKDSIITAKGSFYTAEEWIAKHPAAGLANVTVVCGAGEVNGAIYALLNQFVKDYENLGCDFSLCKTDEEKLAAIEAFEDANLAAEREAVEEAKAREEMQADSLASIAASLEYQNMMTLDDVEG